VPKQKITAAEKQKEIEALAANPKVVARVASEGVNVGFAHCAPALPAVPTQACGIVIAMIAASAVNERVIFSITNRLYRGAPR